MPWIACEVDFPFQPSTLDLADDMGWSPYEAAGRLLVFWGWCLRYAPDGDMSKISHARIAQGMGLTPADGDRLVEAMVKSEWLDVRPYLRVRDWWALVGLFLRGRYKKEPRRWQRIRTLYESHGTAEEGSGADSEGGGISPGAVTVEHSTHSGSCGQEPNHSGAALERLYDTKHNSTVHNSNSTNHPPPRPLRHELRRDDDDEGVDDDSQKIQEELKILKREIIRRSGMRRISTTDEELLITLLTRFGSKVVEACGKLHGGIENIPAYLTRVLEGKDDTAAKARRVEALIRKGVA